MFERRTPAPRWDPLASLPDQVIEFVESLPVPSGRLIGSNHVLLPWQREVLSALYSDPRPRQYFLSTPRKNGKTGLAALIAIAHLLGPCAEDAGEIYIAASDRLQAGVTWRMITRIITAVPTLKGRVTIRAWDKSVEVPETGTVLRALSADARRQHGLSASLVLADEVAQWPSRSLWDALSTSGGARDHSLIVATSTISTDTHFFSDLLDYAQNDPDAHTGCAIYRADEEDDPWDPAVWERANPSYGIIRSVEELESAARQAQRIPSAEAAFRCLYLNQVPETKDGWLSRTDWERCGGEGPDWSRLDGAQVIVGLDLAAVADLTAVVLHWPESGEVWAHAWVSDRTWRRDRARVPYDVWADAGDVTIAPGSVLPADVVRWLGSFLDAHDLDPLAIAYDRWGLAALERTLDDEGVYAGELRGHGQGYRDMSPALEHVEAAVLDGRLRHFEQGILSWAISNVRIMNDPAGNRKPAKPKRDGAPIDPAVALVMAVGAGTTIDRGTPDFAGAVLTI